MIYLAVCAFARRRPALLAAAALAAAVTVAGSRGVTFLLSEAAGQPAEGRQQTRQRERKLRFTFQEQKDYETIEEVISGLEEQLRQTEAQIGKEARNYTRLRELTEEKDRLEQQLEEKMERWMYLSELAEKIESQ